MRESERASAPQAPRWHLVSKEQQQQQHQLKNKRPDQRVQTMAVIVIIVFCAGCPVLNSRFLGKPDAAAASAAAGLRTFKWRRSNA